MTPELTNRIRAGLADGLLRFETDPFHHPVQLGLEQLSLSKPKVPLNLPMGRHEKT